MPLLTLLFFSIPALCMQDTNTQVTREESSEPPDEAFLNWLYQKATQSDVYRRTRKKTNKLKLQKIEPAALAYLLEETVICSEIQQLIAQEVYQNQIDPLFIARLLHENNTIEPIKIHRHSHTPCIKYTHNGRLNVHCTHQKRRCRAPLSFEIAGSRKTALYREKKDRLGPNLYHAWYFVKEQSSKQYITPPLFVIREASGDLISVHHDKRVYRWPISEQCAQDTAFFSKKLSLEEVLLLKHMQRTKDPIDKEQDQLNKECQQHIQDLQEKATNLISRLRALHGEKE